MVRCRRAAAPPPGVARDAAREVEPTERRAPARFLPAWGHRGRGGQLVDRLRGSWCRSGSWHSPRRSGSATCCRAGSAPIAAWMDSPCAGATSWSGSAPERSDDGRARSRSTSARTPAGWGRHRSGEPPRSLRGTAARATGRGSVLDGPARRCGGRAGRAPGRSGILSGRARRPTAPGRRCATPRRRWRVSSATRADASARRRRPGAPGAGTLVADGLALRRRALTARAFAPWPRCCSRRYGIVTHGWCWPRHPGRLRGAVRGALEPGDAPGGPARLLRRAGAAQFALPAAIERSTLRPPSGSPPHAPQTGPPGAARLRPCPTCSPPSSRVRRVAARLADRLRPQALAELVGQEQLLRPEAPLARMLERGRLASLILWGPPGCGKTTLARLLAQEVGEPLDGAVGGDGRGGRPQEELRGGASTGRAGGGRSCSSTRSTASTAPSRTVSCTRSRTAR